MDFLSSKTDFQSRFSYRIVALVDVLFSEAATKRAEGQKEVQQKSVHK
jgi:hypothetical protein